MRNDFILMTSNIYNYFLELYNIVIIKINNV